MQKEEIEQCIQLGLKLRKNLIDNNLKSNVKVYYLYYGLK